MLEEMKTVHITVYMSLDTFFCPRSVVIYKMRISLKLSLKCKQLSSFCKYIHVRPNIFSYNSK